MNIEERLRRLEDEAAIRARKYEYCRHADAQDPERMVSLFTEDCVASYAPDRPPLVGRTALREYYAAALATVVASSHHVSNVEIAFTDEDHAEVRCYLYSWQRFGGDAPDRHRFARYGETWLRTAGGWRQSRLVYRVVGELGPDGPLRIGETLS